LLVDSVESMMMHGLAKPKFKHYESFRSLYWIPLSCKSVEENFARNQF